MRSKRRSSLAAVTFSDFTMTRSHPSRSITTKLSRRSRLPGRIWCCSSPGKRTFFKPIRHEHHEPVAAWGAIKSVGHFGKEVAQTCCLLYRRLAVCYARDLKDARVLSGPSARQTDAFGELLVFGVASQGAAPLIIGSLADCKSAIQQTACLRYVRD